MLVKDFDFIQTAQNYDQIKKTAKHEFFKYVKLFLRIKDFVFIL